MPAATVHTTSCGRYIVSIEQRGDTSANFTCRSLQEARDILRRNRIRNATFAQRLPFDEMIGQPIDEGVSRTPIVLTQP